MRYRHIRRTAIAVLAAIAFVLSLGMLAHALLNSKVVRRAAAKWLEKQAELRNTELGIEQLHWELLPPRVVFHGITLEASGVRAVVDRAAIDLARVRVARRTIEFGTVEVRGVDLRLEGVPDRPARRREPPVRFRIRHLDLRDLAFQGRQLPGKISVELEGVSVAWTTEVESAAGFVKVDRARLQGRKSEPVEATVRASFELADVMTLPSWHIEGPGIELQGSGEIDGKGIRLDGQGTASLDELDRILHLRNKLTGSVQVLSARLDSSAEELLQLDFASDHVQALVFPFEKLRAELVVERDRVHGELRRARFQGGSISGSYNLAHLKGPTRPHSIRVIGDGVPLAGLLEVLRVPAAELSSTMLLEGQLSWNGRAYRAGQGRGVVFLEAGADGLPVDGRVDLEFTPEGLLRFAAEGLSVGRSTIDWQGPLTIGSWEPAWSIRATSAALDETVQLVNSWVKKEVLPPWVSGTGDLQVNLSGPWEYLVVNARLDAQPLLLPPMLFDRVVSEATISGSQLRLGPTRFTVSDGQGEVEGSLSWGESSGQDQLDLDIRGHRIPLAAVAEWLGADWQADGVFSFTGGLNGPLAAARGSWAVGFDDIEIAGQQVGDGSTTVDLVDGRFDARALQFDGGLEGTAWWDVAGTSVGGRLRWPAMPMTVFGEHAERLAGGAADLDIDFELPRDAHPIGHIEALCPDARLVILSDRQTVTVEAELANSVDITASLDRGEQGQLEGRGTLHLHSAENFVAQLVPNAKVPLTGEARVAFDVVWPPGELPEVTGLLNELALELEGRPVTLREAAPFELSARGIGFDSLRFAARDDEMFGRVFVDSQGSLRGNLSGTLDALLLRFLLPEWEPAGRATGVVELLGDLSNPSFEGIAEIHRVSFRLPGTRTIFSNIDGTVLLSSDAFTVEGVSGRFMQGDVRCSGRIGRREGVIDLALNGSVNNLRYDVLPGFITRLSGSWRLIGPVDSLDLSGDLTVDGATLQRREDVANLLLEWFGDSSSTPQAGGLRLDLHVEADETIEVRNPFVRLMGSASLDVTGTSGSPGLIGNIEFSEGGEITLQTLRYELERGSLTFSDPETISPFIEMQARTWVQNYDVTLRLAGTQDRLIPSVSSNPPLTEEEIYAMLSLGYRSESVGSGAMGVGFASSILSSELASQLDRRTGLALPVDQVRVDPFLDSSTGSPARVTVVKQLLPWWTVVVQTDLSEREEVIVSRWYIAPGIFVEASRDIDGAYGLDLKLRRPY